VPVVAHRATADGIELAQYDRNLAFRDAIRENAKELTGTA
jgi:hypothetical protein